MKSWWKSKTLWFNVLGAGAALFGTGGALGHVLAPEEVALGVVIGNAGLRFATNTKLVQ